MRFGIANGNPEMMVRVTQVVSDARTGPGEHEDAGLSIVADLVADQDRPTFWTIHDHSRQKAFGRPTARDRTGGIQNIHGRILVAADVPEGHPRKEAAPHSLQVERPATPAEYLHVIPSSTDEQDRPLDHEDFVLVEPGPDKGLIIGAGILKRSARSWVGTGIIGIHDKRLATGWIRRRLLQRWCLRIRLALRGARLTSTQLFRMLTGHRERSRIPCWWLIPSVQSHYFGRVTRCQDRACPDDSLAQEAFSLLSSQREESVSQEMRRANSWEK